MRPALVSVIIPARDGAATIDAQLDALSRQEYAGDWEVVVVDNASSDDTGARARAWKRHLPGLQVVTPPARAGSSAGLARNFGAAIAGGDLLLYCDADDVVGDGWIAGLVAAAAEADMVSGVLELDRLNDRRIVARFGWAPERDERAPWLGFLPCAVGGNCAIWRPALEAVGGWNERYVSFDDAELAWRVQLAGFRFGFAPRAVVHYRLRPSLRALWRRARRDGEAQVQLFADFRAYGMPRTDSARAVRAWVGRVVHVRDLVGPVSRGEYVRQTGAIVGRAIGSMRRRALYL